MLIVDGRTWLARGIKYGAGNNSGKEGRSLEVWNVYQHTILAGTTERAPQLLKSLTGKSKAKTLLSASHHMQTSPSMGIDRTSECPNHLLSKVSAAVAPRSAHRVEDLAATACKKCERTCGHLI